METGDGWRIAAQRSPGHVPPRWPDPAYPQQAHLDLRVPDLDAGSAKAAGLGVELLRKNENWDTLADPAGHPFDLCLFQAKRETTLIGVMLDCPDAKELSTFYAKLLGEPVTYEGDGVAMIGEDGAQPVMFQQITEYHAPRWPDPAYPQQFHLDVTVDDVDAAEAAVLKLGATSLSSGGVNWRVYADPPASRSASAGTSPKGGTCSRSPWRTTRPTERRQLSGLGPAAALLDPLRDQSLVGTSHPAQLGHSLPSRSASGPPALV